MEPRRLLGPSRFLLVRAMTILYCVIAGPGRADPTAPVGLEHWAFLIGEWTLVETRYGFDGALIQTNTGTASFSLTMNGQRLQEIQSMPHGAGEIMALHLFVFDPRSGEIEIARTDSGHYGFWVIIGTLSENSMHLVEKQPDPDSEVSRRITYERIDLDQFERRLEFSTDHGANWFVRSNWHYTRK